MKNSLLILCMLFTGCVTSQQQVEKKLYQCIIENSTDTYDREVEVNQINLVTKFEELLMTEGFLENNSTQGYRELFGSITAGEVDSIRLSDLLEKAHYQNTDLLGYPTFHLTPNSCVNNLYHEYPDIFKSSESLTGLLESFEAYKQTMGLETVVISIIDAVPNTEFQEKMVYRVPVITAMYSIMEQTYSRYRNSAQEE